MPMPRFKKRAECDAWCELNNPNHDAVWVADVMNAYSSIGYYRGYDWVQKWAIEHGIDYDNAYINAGVV